MTPAWVDALGIVILAALCACIIGPVIYAFMPKKWW